MTTIKQLSDYVIFRLKSEGNTDLSSLKLQKLLYYIQSWSLAFFGKKAFDGEFQAWIHGPVNREIYDLYKDKKNLYSEMTTEDIIDLPATENISKEDKLHADNILDNYANFSSSQLESMTHNEEPWIIARTGYKPYERCENIIDETIMEKYYKARLVN